MQKKHSKLFSKNEKQVKKYIFLLGLIIIGIIFGIVFSLVLSKNDQLIVKNTLDTFYHKPISKDNLITSFKDSLSTNYFYSLIVWILGMSIIGIPIILFLLFGKGFIVGFSIGSIIKIYKVKGIIGVICYLFPHNILSIILSILLSFHALNFSIKLFKYLFLHKDMNIRNTMKKYIKILIICIVGYLISSLIEAFLVPYITQVYVKLL